VSAFSREIVLEHNIGFRPFPGNGIRYADHTGLSYQRMLVEDSLDLGGINVVPGLDHPFQPHAEVEETTSNSICPTVRVWGIRQRFQTPRMSGYHGFSFLDRRNLDGFPPHSLIFVERACEVNNCQVILLCKSVQVFRREIAKALGNFLAEGRHPFRESEILV